MNDDYHFLFIVGLIILSIAIGAKYGAFYGWGLLGAGIALYSLFVNILNYLSHRK